MFKWRWQKQREEDAPFSSPPEGPTVEIPDPDEAVEALHKSIESKGRTDELSRDVHEWLALLKAAREENNFAEGIVQMIKEGK
jgi:hypothetical protein